MPGIRNIEISNMGISNFAIFSPMSISGLEKTDSSLMLGARNMKDTSNDMI
jgi:hypothetical protein